MTFKRITQEDAEKLSQLIEEMNNNLPDKSWFMTLESNIKEVKQLIDKPRFYILGAFDNQTLAGITSLDYKCGKMPEKYTFPDWCNVNKMVEIAFTIVALKYRGKGLMYQMLQEIQKVAIEQGFEYACCTVHKDNYPSKKNILKSGFKYYMSIAQDSKFPRELLLLKL